VSGAAGAWLGVAALALACGRPPIEGPPEIRYGLEACDRCRMTIDDPRFAAALRTEAGEVRRYDDIGDLLVDREGTGIEGSDVWLHDYVDRSWIRAPEAVFVRSNVVTPMGSGLVAFAERSAAEHLARERGGQLLEWSALAGGREAPEHDNHRTP
jgi:copper chaperone NosL